MFGVTTGNRLDIELRSTYNKQINLIGTTMGSPRDFDSMCRFIEQHRYTPEIHHIYPLAKAAGAHRLMEAGEQYGKIVLKM